MSDEAALMVYRVAQEALSNVRRHVATASRVSVALVFEPESVVLQVEDDGPGFVARERAALLQEGHLSLAGMVERAPLFGGELAVESQPGSGTSVLLRLRRVGASTRGR